MDKFKFATIATFLTIVCIFSMRCWYLYDVNGTILANSIRQYTAYKNCGKGAYIQGKELHLVDSTQYVRYYLFQNNFDYHGIDTVIVANAE